MLIKLLGKGGVKPQVGDSLLRQLPVFPLFTIRADLFKPLFQYPPYGFKAGIVVSGKRLWLQRVSQDYTYQVFSTLLPLFTKGLVLSEYVLAKLH